MPDLFPGFAERRIMTEAAEIFVRTGGSGPPLLLLHGYPQTHVCWHKIAPELARHCTLVIADLRGYGASSAPPGDTPEHMSLSKRAMARGLPGRDARAWSCALHGGGHDRGGRVAYRLALDHPEAVGLAADRHPADGRGVAARQRRERRRPPTTGGSWHSLRRCPRRLISTDPPFYLEHTLKSWTKSRDLSPFSAEALAHTGPCCKIQVACTRSARTTEPAPASIGNSTKRISKSGRKITCPTFVAWGRDYLGKRGAEPLQVWRAWCSDLSGAEINSGHFLAEENPHATLAAVLPFLASLGASLGASTSHLGTSQDGPPAQGGPQLRPQMGAGMGRGDE